MASLFDFKSARAGFNISAGVVPGTLEKVFMNRLTSLRNSIANKGTTDVDLFRIDYLIREVSSKSPAGKDANPPAKRHDLAIAKTLNSNEHCQRFNEAVAFGPANKMVLIRARHIIAQILGKFSYNYYRDSSFSGGASTNTIKERSDIFAKYGNLEHGVIEVTPRAYPRLMAIIEQTPTMYRSYLTARLSGRNPIRITGKDLVKTVPKNSTIDRTILMQPTGNNYLQKALGKCIRRKLRAVGIDLCDQTTNQELARVGSIYGSHATIDLSSASDTVNSRIVYELLPYDWYVELEALRCDYGAILDASGKTNQVVKWHMFSAMGNAFTFELESLIFYAIALATAESKGPFVGRISVYGDDIIVPNSIAHEVCENLTACGFLVNDKKTHIVGRFRESCGAHWYRGIDVKPFYIRTTLENLDSIMRLANQLRKWSSDGKVCDPRFYKLWEWVASFVPSIFFGGFDLESSNSLVTPDRPRKKLVPVTATAQIGGEGALAQSFQIGCIQTFSEWNIRTCREKGVSGFFIEQLRDLSREGHMTLVRGVNGDGTKYTVDTEDLSNNPSKALYYIRRNRAYGRYTSPPVWILSDNHTVVER